MHVRLACRRLARLRILPSDDGLVVVGGGLLLWFVHVHALREAVFVSAEFDGDANLLDFQRHRRLHG